MILLNPKQQNFDHLDEETRTMMVNTIHFFENKGKKKLKQDDRDRVWNHDFVQFIKKENLFSSLLTPSGYGTQNSRWDTYRNCAFNEILGFYGLCYWYTWQVSMLGLGPIWMGPNEELKEKTAQLLQQGSVFAFGLSEKQHGADLYATEMMLTPMKDGTYKADGGKYYIGNANEAALITTFGKNSDTDEFVFFVINPKHETFYLVQNVVNSQNYVAEFALQAYPLTDSELVSHGQDAWDAALNTINVCKFNLGWASIGMCTHALYEAINHATHRTLYNRSVTDFPHIKQLFTDAYCRLIAMKLFSLRAADYMRAASPTDRRYLLYNPMVKMKVTMQGEQVINLLWDIIAAKGFEKDTYFEMATRDIRALPKLEGTAQVNMALIIKFMTNYFFYPQTFPEIPKRDEVTNDDFLFNQGSTSGLAKIRFHDFNLAYMSFNLPNGNLFFEQVKGFKQLLRTAAPSPEQSRDIDFLLTLGELFTLVVYGQLIIENSKIYSIPDELLDQIFDVLIRDFSYYALNLYTKPSTTPAQMDLCLKMIRKPVVDDINTNQIWQKYVLPLADTYEMNE